MAIKTMSKTVESVISYPKAEMVMSQFSCTIKKPVANMAIMKRISFSIVILL